MVMSNEDSVKLWRFYPEIIRIIESLERLASAQERIAAAAEDANKI
jgi:hypothetical protein